MPLILNAFKRLHYPVKSAQWVSKEWPQFRGVLALSPDNARRPAKFLCLQPAEEIWGLGNRIVKKLEVMVLNTAM